MNRNCIFKALVKRVIFSTFTILSFSLSAQTVHNHILKPEKQDFVKTLEYLSSDRMEGREAGTTGAAKASEYIAVMMQAEGLHPYGDKSPDNTRSWFQNFEAVSYKADRDSMELLTENDGKTLVFNTNEAGVVKLRNVLGIIPGKDTSRSIIVGAHYDHLGIREGKTYNGADDNASGVSGLLELAGVWSAKPEKPPCNIIFASWTAEEKGEIGSKYFLQNLKTRSSGIIVSVNLDMISRSAPEDSARLQISIGTLPSGENLRTIARNANMKLSRPFELDLWDVSGHYGSDYAFFAERHIPVMTFFSGFNEDYHTPGDRIEKVDLQKMSDILELVNECIFQVTEEIRTNKLNTE